ncbi:2-hydroxyacid dehydrogenase [Microbacterium rhizomatis]|uniref:2-hydroxyacid dehydrogenase n=1 Tax=Microbacterium rhizomatis TaxID=1631477 RepID=A0A5J5IY07_9MICO|nr:2-hydroxyacid dehydrogenase [Microbacterium rhizomatis]KAA9104768.1 2-hydroxyacid dehydrogenase [Microbacterium rhizomatis]
MTEPAHAGPVTVSVPDGPLVEAVSTFEHATVTVWDIDRPAEGHIDLVVLPYMNPRMRLSLLATATPRLVQTQTIGVDDVLAGAAAGFPVANAAGVHEASTAEHTLALVLASLRRIPEFRDDARRVGWRHEVTDSLIDKRVLLVGTGGVGRAIASRLGPFGVHLTTVGRTRRTVEGAVVHAVSELTELAAEADVLIIAVPLSELTRGLIDATVLERMPDGGLVVNVARGPVVDTTALLGQVRTGRLRAALDVTDPEPLPPDHELLRLANVLVTPHVGGASSAMLPRMIALVRDQIARLAENRPPFNVVHTP